MNPPERSTSRRGVIASALVGVVSGGAWGAAIQAFSRPSTPTLSVIGEQDAQLALLDTTDVRMLFLLGNPMSSIDHLPSLMTTFRQRIDLVIGSDTALTNAMGRIRERWNVRHTFAFPDDSRIGYSGPGSSRISGDLSMNVGWRGVLDLRLTTRNAWRTDVPGRYLWIAVWKQHDYEVVLGPDARSIRTLAVPGAALTIVPDADPATIEAETQPGSLAVNRSDRPEPTGTMRVVSIYPNDVAQFTLRAEGVALPPWATGDDT